MDISVFKGLKLVISTPTMNRQVCEQYAESMVLLTKYLQSCGIGYYYHRVKDTYLPRGRNVLAFGFLETDASIQLCLDSDMGFDALDVMRMLYHMVTTPEIEILGAPYPQKFIDWPRVIEAVKRNPDITARQLECSATGSWTFKGLDGMIPNMGAPVQLNQIGEQPPHVATGVLLIKRSAYETMREKMPELAYFDGQTQKTAWRFFHCDMDHTGRWIGEDAWFCRRWHELGGKIWLAPWVKTEHVGVVSFPGDVSQIMDAGMELPA